MILAVLQARVSSSRLPGKVLLPIQNQPMLARQIDRVSRSNYIDKLVVATSVESSDDPIETLCEKKQVFCFRGSLDDVLDRFYQATVRIRPAHVVRLTGDCPLTDPEVIDAVIRFHLEQQNDYTSNSLEPTFPDGLDVEAFRFEVLEEAWKRARLKSQREHVTSYIYQHPDMFKISNYRNVEDLSSLRWTVDEKEDYELVVEIYDRLFLHKPEFGMKDILELLDSVPSLKFKNIHIGRNEGYEKSLQSDAESTSE